jgi:hypothetical protein
VGLLHWNGANGIGLRVADIRADIARDLGIDVSESTIRAVLKGPLGHSRTKRDSRCYRRWTPENIEYDKISFHLRRRFDLFRRYYALRLRQAICRNGSWRRSTARDSLGGSACSSRSRTSARTATKPGLSRFRRMSSSPERGPRSSAATTTTLPGVLQRITVDGTATIKCLTRAAAWRGDALVRAAV